MNRSRAAVAQARAEGGLDVRIWPDGQAPSLWRLLVDMIEEYVGHADLIRESVDVLPGEDPPPR